MKDYQHHFLDLAIEYGALTFGEFELKSGRNSPYFFNAGKFDGGQALATLGKCYADAIVDSSLEYDLIFGPAYKGIPLAAAVTMSMALHHHRNVPYAFNRKEAKAHGEGGCLVGASVAGKRVLIVDDVITAGTAIREVMALLASEDATAAGVIIGLDRQERGTGEKSAVQEVSEQFAIPVVSVTTLNTIVEFLQESDNLGTHISRVEEYRRDFGA